MDASLTGFLGDRLPGGPSAVVGVVNDNLAVRFLKESPNGLLASFGNLCSQFLCLFTLFAFLLDVISNRNVTL